MVGSRCATPPKRAGFGNCGPRYPVPRCQGAVLQALAESSPTQTGSSRGKPRSPHARSVPTQRDDRRRGCCPLSRGKRRGCSQPSPRAAMGKPRPSSLASSLAPATLEDVLGLVLGRLPTCPSCGSPAIMPRLHQHAQAASAAGVPGGGALREGRRSTLVCWAAGGREGQGTVCQAAGRRIRSGRLSCTTLSCSYLGGS